MYPFQSQQDQTGLDHCYLNIRCSVEASKVGVTVSNTSYIGESGSFLYEEDAEMISYLNDFIFPFPEAKE